MPAAARRLRLRRDDRCAGCERELAAGDLGLWDPGRREVRCLDCERTSDDASTPSGAPVLSSTAGASARREYEHRRSRREERVRDRYGALGGLVLALTAEPRGQRSWAVGAEGEAELAAKLERWTEQAGVILLHDRRVPATRGNIDHIAIGPAGVFVIDAKRYRGRIALDRRGGLLSARTEHLVVGGRDRTKLIDGVERQVGVVRNALGAAGEVSVSGVLCFVDGDWPMLGSLRIRDVPIVPPRKLARLAAAPGPLARERILAIAEQLASQLPAA